MLSVHSVCIYITYIFVVYNIYKGGMYMYTLN